MKKFLFFFCFLLLAIGSTIAQPMWSIATCSNLTSTTYGPMYSTSTANATNRTAIIYPATQLVGVANTTLTSMFIKRATASGSMLGTPNFKIYLLETSSTDWGAGSLDWATATGPATLVYDGNPVSAVGSSAGFKEFSLTTTFAYGTQNLAVFFEYTNSTTSNSISWDYEYGIGCSGNNNNTGKYTNNTTGVLPATLASSNYRRPVIGFNYSLPPCTVPPTAGIAISNIDTACSGEDFILNLSGNSFGDGQTYQWQYSTTGTAPWTDIGTADI